MLDSILNTVRRGAQRVQRRGEEVAHVARLRVEVFQLGRELDGLYARLGRSYHAGAEVSVLQGVREDIRRVEEEIRARERLIEELGEVDTELPVPATSSSTSTGPATAVATPYTPPEVSPMTRHDAPSDSVPAASAEFPQPGEDTASMGHEAGRDPQRRETARDQADNMKGHDDPLAK